MGGIESTQGEKKPLLTKAESNPPKATFTDVAYGNLPPSIEIQHSTITPAPSQVPSLELPRLVVDTDGSIKLELPEKIAANELLAKQLSDALYFLFFFPSEPLPVRDPKVHSFENLHAGQGRTYKKTCAAVGVLNALVELLEACGVPSQDFLSAALRAKDDADRARDFPPTLKVFLVEYLGFTAGILEPEQQKISSQCRIVEGNFDIVYKKLTAIENSDVGSLGVGRICNIATYIYDHPDPDIVYNQDELRRCEMLVLYVVLRHQLSWLSKSPDLKHLHMAAKATVLLHKIKRRGM